MSGGLPRGRLAFEGGADRAAAARRTGVGPTACRAVEIGLSLGPDVLADRRAQGAAVVIGVGEVDAALAAELPASSLAALKVGQTSTVGSSGVAPGSMNELPGRTVTLAPNRSLPVNCWRTWSRPRLKVGCPDTYSGNGGSGRSPPGRGARSPRG